MDTICSFRGKHRFLSNFYQSPVEYDGLVYPSVEAAYHAQKCASEEGRIKYTRVKNPTLAKMMGRREQLPDNWDAKSYDIMAAIVRAKFAVPELAAMLQATGDAYLEEGNHWHDNLWGNCSCDKCREIEGQNRLGRILMEVRSTLNRQ